MSLGYGEPYWADRQATAATTTTPVQDAVESASTRSLNTEVPTTTTTGWEGLFNPEPIPRNEPPPPPPQETFTIPGPSTSHETMRRVLTFCVVAIVLLICGMIIMGVFLGLYRSESTADSTIRGTYPAVRAASTRPMLSNGTLFLTVPVVDGVRINTGDRVLLKNELNPQLNGIYVRAICAPAWIANAMLRRYAMATR